MTMEQEDKKMVEIINSWSAPRSLSTGLMYSFAQRDDIEVLDEPLFGHYYRITGIDNPYQEELNSRMETNGDKVIKDILHRPGEKKYRYCKHIANQILSCDTNDLLKTGKHFILIRDPLNIVPSFDKVSPATFLELGLAELVSIYSRLCELGNPPTIVDSAQLQENPEAVLRGLCDDLDIPFQAAMLKWEAGPKPMDGVWAPWWYKSVHGSTCFTAAREYPAEPFPLHLYGLLEQCLPFYNILKRQVKRSSFQSKYIPNLLVPANEKLLVWVGNKIVPRDGAKISVFDSTVQGGDLVWEGLRVYCGKIFKLDEHLDRLLDAAKELDFSNVPTREEVKHAIFKTLIINGMFDNVHIRLTLTRGEKITPEMDPDSSPYGCTLIVLPEWTPPFDEKFNGITLMTVSTRKKSPNIEWNNAKADNAIMLDQFGFVSETPAMNVFLVKKDHVLIPNIHCSLNGVTCATVINLVKKEKLAVEQRQINLLDLQTADEVWTIGSKGELIAVIKIDQSIIGDGKAGPITQRIQIAFKKLTKESGVLIPTYTPTS